MQGAPSSGHLQSLVACDLWRAALRRHPGAARDQEGPDALGYTGPRTAANSSAQVGAASYLNAVKTLLFQWPDGLHGAAVSRGLLGV